MSTPDWMENTVKECTLSLRHLFQNLNSANKAKGTNVYGDIYIYVYIYGDFIYIYKYAF